MASIFVSMQWKMKLFLKNPQKLTDDLAFKDSKNSFS